jgi:hypothetical protein
MTSQHRKFKINLSTSTFSIAYFSSLSKTELILSSFVVVSSLSNSTALTHATEELINFVVFHNDIPTAFRLCTTFSFENCKKEAWDVVVLPKFGVESKLHAAFILSARSKEC